MFSYCGNRKQIGLYNSKIDLFRPLAKLKSQGYKKYLYGEDLQIETMLGEQENRLAQLLQIVSQGKVNLSQGSEQVKDLIYFTILADFRNPAKAEEIEASNTALIKEAIKELDDKQLKALVDKLKINNTMYYSLSHIQDALITISDLKIKILNNNTEKPFVTSDNPVVKYNKFLEGLKSLRPSIGLGAMGLIILYPLSPKYCLVLYDSKTYKVGNRRDNVVVINDDRFIFEVNSLQSIYSDKNIYFNELISEKYAKALHNRIRNFEKPNQPKVITMPSQKPGDNGRYIGVIRSDCRLGLKLDQIKLIRKAKRAKIDVGELQLREVAKQQIG